LHLLVDAGNTVVVVEHEMDVVVSADWVIDLGRAGRCGRPDRRRRHTAEVARAAGSRTAPYLAARLGALSRRSLEPG